MVFGPTSRAVRCLKKKKKKMAKSRFCQFPYPTLTADLAMLGYFGDKTPFQKHNKLSERPSI